MLSKEEMEEALRIGNDRIVREYINQLERENYNFKIISKAEIEQREQLETDKQKLIEKLEETIKYKEELIDLEYEGYKEYYARTGSYPNQMKLNVYKLTGEKNKAQEILKILKGEKE